MSEPEEGGEGGDADAMPEPEEPSTLDDLKELAGDVVDAANTSDGKVLTDVGSNLFGGDNLGEAFGKALTDGLADNNFNFPGKDTLDDISNKLEEGLGDMFPFVDSVTIDNVLKSEDGKMNVGMQFRVTHDWFTTELFNFEPICVNLRASTNLTVFQSFTYNDMTSAGGSTGLYLDLDIPLFTDATLLDGTGVYVGAETGHFGSGADGGTTMVYGVTLGF